MSARTARGAEPQLVAVAIAVQADPVAGGDDLGGERRVARDLLADEEEGRADAARGQHLEHGRRPLAVRPVVEGQAVAAAAERAVGDPERRRAAARSAPASAGNA